MTAVDAAALVVTFTCARCSRTTDHPKDDHWFLHRTPIVVQGITLGLCPSCALGTTAAPEGDVEKHCGGGCKGDYKAATGTYYEATAGREKWSCWDLACVEAWADEQPWECEECGHDLDFETYRYVNGKRTRL